MNLLRQMLRGLTPAEPPRPQYYRVACPEGHPLHGERTEGYQALRCPTCGAGIFVLPRSPLPDPPAPAPKARPKAAETRRGAEDGPIALTDPPPQAEIEGDDGPGESAEPGTIPLAPIPVPASARPAPPRPASARPTPRAEPAAVPPPARTRPRPKPEPAARRPAPAARPEPAPEPEPEPKPVAPARPAVPEAGMIVVPRRRGRRRHLAAFAVVAALVGTAVSVNVWRQRRQALPAVAEAGRVQGLEALDAGDFDTARILLSRAARAVDAMGGEVEGADKIRQGALEAAIFTDLDPQTLEEIMDEAATKDKEEWASWFSGRHRGRSIIVDARVSAEPGQGPGPGRGYVVDYAIASRGPSEPRVGRLDFSGFRLFEQQLKPKVGDRVIIGARLASIGREGTEWRFALEPDSGVRMSHDAALEALGMSPTEDPPGGGGGAP